MSFFSPNSQDYTGDKPAGFKAVAITVPNIRCRICQLVITTTDLYRHHLIDNHYELLTEDERNGIITQTGEILSADTEQNLNQLAEPTVET